jgi:predicted PolB exonuclease-like 3'-5' exonuclease
MKIIKELDLNDVVILDIETVKIVPKLEKGTDLYDSWEYKMRYAREAEKFGDESLEYLFDQKAALYSEFAKVVCISIGKIKDGVLKFKSYSGDNEKELLNEFFSILEGLQANNSNLKIAGHNLLGFDIPFLMRRGVINGLDLPSMIDIAHLKPWEIKFVVDTMSLWKGTGYTNSSLINIAVALGLPSPKMDINGSETSEVYYRGEIDRIVKYCESDILCCANIIRKIRGEEVVTGEAAQIKAEKVPIITKLNNTKKITKKEEEKLTMLIEAMPEHEKELANKVLEAAKS